MEINGNLFREKLIGNNCWSIHMTYPNSLVLNFGNQIGYKLGKFESQYKEDWNLYSEYCIWRIVMKNSIICSSYLDSGENNRIIQQIKLGKLKDLIHNDVNIIKTF